MNDTIKAMAAAAVKAAMVVCFAAAAASSQTESGAVSANRPKPIVDGAAAGKILTPKMTQFRDVGIGTPADELKKAWGKPEIEDEDGFLYELSGEQTVQIAMDGDKKVTAIAITFRDGSGAPKAAEVFGPDEKFETKENGSMFHMVRYPEAGYWVSYSSLGAGKPVVLMFKKL